MIRKREEPSERDGLGMRKLIGPETTRERQRCSMEFSTDVRGSRVGTGFGAAPAVHAAQTT